MSSTPNESKKFAVAKAWAQERAGITILRNFVCRRFGKVIRTLRYADLDKDPQTIRTLLVMALRTLDPPPPVDILEAIVASSVSVNDDDDCYWLYSIQYNGQEPLIHEACRIGMPRGSLEVLLWLIKKETNLGHYFTHQKSPKDGLNPLQIILRNHPKLLKIILPHLLPVDSNNKNPESNQDSSGTSSSLSSFLTQKDPEGRLPVHSWAEFGTNNGVDTARMLIPPEIYADSKLLDGFLMQRDDRDMTPFDHIMQRSSGKTPDRTHILELLPRSSEAQFQLLRYQHNKNNQKRGGTILHLLLHTEHSRAIWDRWSNRKDKFNLLTLGRNPTLLEIQDEDGNTPLHVMCQTQHGGASNFIDTSCLQELIPKASDARSRLLQLCNNQQQTPLDLALLRQPIASAEQLQMLMVGTDDSRHPADQRHPKSQLLPLEVVVDQLSAGCRHSSSRCGINHDGKPLCYCIFQVPLLNVWELLMPREAELKRDFFVKHQPLANPRIHNHSSRTDVIEYLILQGFEFEDLYAPGGNLFHAIFGSIDLPEEKKCSWFMRNMKAIQYSSSSSPALTASPASLLSCADSSGRFPLHLAMRLSHGATQGIWRVFREQLSPTLPTQLWTFDRDGRLPLHIALEAGSRFFFIQQRNMRGRRGVPATTTHLVVLGVIGCMVDLEPDLVTAVDGATGFYPFMLSALIASSSSTGSDTSEDVSTSATDYTDDSVHLSTIYELLRRAPQVIGHLICPTNPTKTP